MTATGFVYLLDTNIISDMVRRPAGRAAKALARVDVAQVCTSIIVVSEIRYGVARRGSQKLTAQVDAVLSVLPALSLESPADRHYGDIRAELAGQGQPIGGNDLLIAAQARALGLTVVTDNIREFERVRGLRTDNWLDQA
ncbi:type II toxin-antitoxin system VapC family toxin [Salinisphaera japonica]|uniref:Ribonuclease VapC n=1 Tax=Salinisphaera japonica YTM-1 TaxID=1209778 RepID=A0A423Q0G6_9GAMM|nr:type II toxin-antitoxin system VapC family toxin [Salinisphaera japonica]ROO31407.1 transcriptional regulator [Salinisphaera japonica YTM-1]